MICFLLIEEGKVMRCQFSDFVRLCKIAFCQQICFGDFFFCWFDDVNGYYGEV